MKKLAKFGWLCVALVPPAVSMPLGGHMAVWHLGSAQHGDSANYTTTTPDPIPYVWLDAEAATILAAHGGDYEAAAKATAENGVNKVWECYVAGISPTNAAARFEATIEMGADGKPVVTWTPDLNEGGAKRERVYVVEGQERLGDGWGPTNAASRFFRVKVAMPEE